MAIINPPKDALEMPVDWNTVEVLGSKPKDENDPLWTGLDLSRAILREQSTAMMWMVGKENAPPDHHLDVPWWHPNDGPHPKEPQMIYRVRPRWKNWRFQQTKDGWKLVKQLAVEGPPLKVS